ncbi:MAG: signal peptidase I [Candidatus Moranbacteria bacterium]|nr:signal peptidase I [Candidatus Moranbacteria bacterium]
MTDKILKILKNLIWTAIVVFLILIGITFIPIKGNYKVYTVQSGSMEPAIHTGSLIFVKSQESYSVDDIVTRATKGSRATVTHRIISKKTEGSKVIFETKGDANEDPDRESVSQDTIIGKKFFQIPYIGYPVGYARTMPGFILLIIIPAVIIVYEEIRKIKEEIVNIWKKKNGKENLLVEDNLSEKKYTRVLAENNITNIGLETKEGLIKKEKISRKKG